MQFFLRTGWGTQLLGIFFCARAGGAICFAMFFARGLAVEARARAGSLMLEALGWRLEAASWRRLAGGWRLEVGGSRFGVGGCRLAAGDVI